MVALIVIAVISFVSWHHYRDQKALIEKIVEKSSVILTESVVANIQTAMKAGHTTGINTILHEAKVHDHIKELRIIDKEGMIIHSADTNEIGKELTEEEREKTFSTKQNKIYFTNKISNFDSYTRILNAPECHSCHDASKPFIAFIEIEISLNELTSFIRLEKRSIIISSALMILLIIGATFIILVLFVD